VVNSGKPEILGLIQNFPPARGDAEDEHGPIGVLTIVVFPQAAIDVY